LGLKPHRFCGRTKPFGKKAAELKREGRSAEWISRHFNQQGIPSPRGKPWTARIVYNVINRVGEKVETLGDIHRKAILEARGRGLTYREMAVEFNEKKIPRRKDCDRPWTERNLAHTWSKLNLRQAKRQQKESTISKESESVILKKSA
jgi:hypothetical protein